jgi:hypothetical protein
MLEGHPFGEVLRLLEARLREFGIGGAVGVLPADRECVTHENQFHGD